MMLIWLLVILVFVFIFLGQYSSFGFTKLPPGPDAFQLIRKLSSLPNKPHVALRDLANIYGPLMSCRLGGQLLVVASSPSTAMEIFKTKNRIFSSRFMPSVFQHIPGINHASLSMSRECNDSWRFVRSLAQQAIYSSRAVRAASGARMAKVVEMVRFVRAKAGQAVNVEDVIFATFTNIISNSVTSKDLLDTGGEGERDEKVLRFIRSIIADNFSSIGVADFFPVLRGLDFWNKGKAMDTYRDIQVIWDDIIKERRGTPMHDRVKSNERHDFLDVLNERGFSDGHISLLLTEQLIGATESTALTSVWFLVELIKNRDIFHKVRYEIEHKAVGGDGTLNESLLCECQYFQACKNETLRLHLPGPFIPPRIATETCTVNGFRIPKGSLVVVNAWAIHTGVESWEDATRFDPLRFLEAKKAGADFSFIPFGGGLRMCPGWNVAMSGVQTLVASLVLYFDWSLPDGADPTQLDTSERFETTLKMNKPLCLIPTPRDKYIASLL